MSAAVFGCLILSQLHRHMGERVTSRIYLAAAAAVGMVAMALGVGQ